MDDQQLCLLTLDWGERMDQGRKMHSKNAKVGLFTSQLPRNNYNNYVLQTRIINYSIYLLYLLDGLYTFRILPLFDFLNFHIKIIINEIKNFQIYNIIWFCQIFSETEILFL